MGNERYEGKVYEREVADEKCRLAESNGRPCIHISYVTRDCLYLLFLIFTPDLNSGAYALVFGLNI